MADSRRRRALRHSRCPTCRQRGHFANECTSSLVIQHSFSTTSNSDSHPSATQPNFTGEKLDNYHEEFNGTHEAFISSNWPFPKKLLIKMIIKIIICFIM